MGDSPIGRNSERGMSLHGTAGSPVESEPTGRGAAKLMLADGHTAGVLEAHHPPGRLHIAVSVQLITFGGQWLLQRRSRGKALFAGKWANSCCTHPYPSEPPVVAAARRLAEELGVEAVPLFPARTFTYRATDPVSGLVEHEHDHIFVGITDLATVPDPSEIEELWCGPFEEAVAIVSGQDGAPWAATVLQLAANRVCALLPYLRRDEEPWGNLSTTTDAATPRAAGQWS